MAFQACPELANYDFRVDLWKEIRRMAAGTLPSVGTARSVGRRTSAYFLFTYYGNKAILCIMPASV